MTADLDSSKLKPCPWCGIIRYTKGSVIRPCGDRKSIESFYKKCLEFEVE